jgi:hypothetical protein
VFLGFFYFASGAKGLTWEVPLAVLKGKLGNT